MYPLIQIGKDVYLPTYLLIISLAYILSTLWLVRRTERFEESRNLALDLALAVMVGGFVGSRLFHVLFEYPEIYFQSPLRIFKVWQGGFVFYGGFFGAVIGTTLIFWWKKKSPWKWFDIFAPLFPFGYALGRISCLFAGCCYGRECQYFWGIRFPRWSEAPANIVLHPTQIYAVLWELTVLALILYLEKKRPVKSPSQPLGGDAGTFLSRLLWPPGQLLFIWMALHGLGRIFMESFRADFRGAPILGLSISTWISILLLIASTFTLYTRARKEGSSPR
jgi:phosphatidylglycerol:prolipoprotein diacylglycerol transferase